MTDEIKTVAVEAAIETAKDVGALEVEVSQLRELVSELRLAFDAHVLSNVDDFSNVRASLESMEMDITGAREQMAALQETLESAADDAEETLREEITAEVAEQIGEVAEVLEDEVIDETAAKSVEEHEKEEHEEIKEEPEVTEEKPHRHFIRL